MTAMLKRALLPFIFLFLLFVTVPFHHVSAAGEFKSTWKTDNEGTSASNQITIPTSGGGYNYDVDWGDASSSTGVTGDSTHTYADPGTYQIAITGTFPGIVFAFGGDRLKILSVDQWGTNVWQFMDSAFGGCTNMTIEATDAPDLSAAGDLTYMLRGTGVTTEDLSGWDVSQISSLLGLFQDTSFNGNITTWDVSHVERFDALFYADPIFDQNISGWDTSSATNMNALFFHDAAFDQDISGWDVSQVTDMADMFDSGGISAQNYDTLLVGWSSQSLQADVNFDAGSSTYCDTTSRALLTDAPNNWIITDGGIFCAPVVSPIPRQNGRRRMTSYRFDAPVSTTPSAQTTGISPYDGSFEDITPVVVDSYIRGEHYDTVYYISTDRKRHPLYDAQTYFTWQDSFDSIAWVTDATLSTLTLGEPLLPKSGVVLVKLVSDPSVYAIEQSALRLISSEQIAIDTYGSDWADYVIDLTPTLFEHFTSGIFVVDGESVDKSIMKKRSEIVVKI